MTTYPCTVAGQVAGSEIQFAVRRTEHRRLDQPFACALQEFNFFRGFQENRPAFVTGIQPK
jgi:hypothetical protein